MSRRKKADDVGDAHEATAVIETNGAPNGEANGQPKKAPPVFKCGPIPTGKGESVSGVVWANLFHAADGRDYTVHSIAVEASYFSEKDGVWKPSSGFRASQLSTLEYVLRRCGDFVFAARDAQLKRDEPKADEEIPI